MKKIVIRFNAPVILTFALLSLLALLLGNLCESNFRRALSMSLGDYSIFLTRPITVVLLILTVLSLVLPAIGQLRKKSKAAK